MIQICLSASTVAIFLLSGGLAVTQVSPTPDLTVVSQIERLGLVGALLLAVGVLRRSEVKKDEQIVLMVKTLAEALTAATDSNKEVRQTLEESIKTKNALRESLDNLALRMTELPCVLQETERVKVRR